MPDIRYSLEKYKGRSTRYHCPQCHQRTFTRYVDNHTNKHLSDYTGRCNRVEKCGYHFTPKMYFVKNGYKLDDFPISTPKSKPIIKPPSCIDKKLM
ncbi:PG0870-related protein [Carboxylicivirga marina]|uniref:PG0870-related protein n=1 Tax=Carboxylicivirga marina TaxID=2800988 RepID=UPI002592FA6B|nr:PG0870-related protein [uncultured Carboxylicivirga sp.]